MALFTLSARQFKKMTDPSKKTDHVKYVCYLQAASLSSELSEWMGTNPRDQKMTTQVAKNIRHSLLHKDNFHELNRGLLFSAESVLYDNKNERVIIEMSNPDIHGNIDGGHTMRAIFDVQANSETPIPEDRYVFAEIFTGITSPVELAAARNTSVQVDLKSIEELNDSFEVIKTALSPLPFSSRIAYKMNEHLEDPDILPIDVREIITVLNMFNQRLYPVGGKEGTGADRQPIQSYTGKETSLKRFLGLGKEVRERVTLEMTPIIEDIFTLWDAVETSFAYKGRETKKRYGMKKYAKYNGGDVIDRSLYYKNELRYLIPKGIMYPVVGAFRALVTVGDNGGYGWAINPQEVWDTLGAKLVTTVLEEKEDNPEYLGKSGNLWSNLYKEVLLYRLMNGK